MLPREAAHMGLVDDRVFPRRARCGLAPQVKAVSMTLPLKLNGALSRASKVRSLPVSDLVAEQGRIPLQLSHELLGVGIEQEFVRIEAVASRRLVRTMHAITVDRAGARVRQIAVPDFVGVLGQLMRSISRWPPASNRQSSTLVALAENRAKFTPSPSHVAPSG